MGMRAPPVSQTYNNVSKRLSFVKQKISAGRCFVVARRRGAPLKYCASKGGCIFPEAVTNHQHPQGSTHAEDDKTVFSLRMIRIGKLNCVIIKKNR
jgi:hypothetical protein